MDAFPRGPFVVNILLTINKVKLYLRKNVKISMSNRYRHNELVTDENIQ